MRKHGFSSLYILIISLIVGIVLVTSLCLSIFSILNTIANNNSSVSAYRSQIENDIKDSLKNETQIAISIIDQYYQMQQNGILTEEEAKKQAADRIRELRYDDGNGYFWIDTEEGINVVLLGRDIEGTSRLDLTDPDGNHFIQDMINNGKKEGGGYTSLMFAKPNETTPLPKINYTVSYTPYKWIVGTGVWIDHIDTIANNYMTHANEALLRNINSQILLMLILFAIISIIAVFISRMIVTPIKGVTSEMERMANGDLRDTSSNNKIKINIMTRRDEIGKMACSMDVLQKNMRSLIKKISDTTSYVTEAAEELTENTKQSALASNLVAQSIVSVAESCGVQNNTVEDAGASTENFVDRMAEFSEQIEDSSHKVTNTNNAAHKGKTEISTAVEQMHTIEGSVLSTSKAVEELGEQVNQIGTIVDAISEIANETNLLSLNASIEAARAGEAGKGFAVVATEIQKLATQSNDSAREIADLIAGIQKKSEDAVNAMKVGLENVQNGTVVVEQSGQIFDEIADMVENVADSSREMSNILSQLNNETNNVKNAFSSIREQSSAISEETETVSASSQEQSASMHEIASASEKLAESAQELQVEVAKFQV